MLLLCSVGAACQASIDDQNISSTADFSAFFGKQLGLCSPKIEALYQMAACSKS